MKFQYSAALLIGFAWGTAPVILNGQQSPATSRSSVVVRVQQEEAKKPTEFTVADGKISMTAPAAWKKIDPAVRMIEAEFSIPPVDGDQEPGRLTIMGAGGSVDANIERWIGQVKQADGSSSKDAAKISQREVAGSVVHELDISGTYMDQRGPNSPLVAREKFQLIGVIIETPGSGNYFVKLYGPLKTIAQNKAALDTMIDGLRISK